MQEDGLLDEIIERLLDVRNARPGKQVQLTEHEMRQLCLTSKGIFMDQPNLLELEAPIKICGARLGRVQQFHHRPAYPRPLALTHAHSSSHTLAWHCVERCRCRERCSDVAGKRS